MGKIKDWFKPNPKAIIQHLYATAIILALGYVGPIALAFLVALAASISAILSKLDPAGLATMNLAIAFLIYFMAGLVVVFGSRFLLKSSMRFAQQRAARNGQPVESKEIGLALPGRPRGDHDQAPNRR